MKKILLALLLAVGACGGVQWNDEVFLKEPYAVVIKNTCDGGTGSGALVGNTVYTAYHVVEDCLFSVVSGNDEFSFGGIAVLEDYNEVWDVATLTFVDKEGPRIPIGEPKVGGVCTHNAFPVDERKCGHIYKIDNEPWGLYLDFKVIPGNSGSPLYQNGKLVGVVTARWPWRGSSINLGE
jgi:S1-C subfamily serine protease